MAAYTNFEGTTGTWGFDDPETGLFIDSMSENTSDSPEFLLNNYGQKVGFAHDVNKESNITMSGEVNGVGGRMADKFGAAVVNMTNVPNELFGVTTGSIYLTAGSTTKSRSGWYSASMNYSRWPEIT